MSILIGFAAGLIVIAAAWGLIRLAKRIFEFEEESFLRHIDKSIVHDHIEGEDSKRPC